MEPIFNTSDKVKAVEVLFFDEAEVQKMKGGMTAFAASGPLSVLYFPTYDRFALRLNDWTYPLLQRLPILMSSDKTNTASRTYAFPARNGYFQLTLGKIQNLQQLTNFETILTSNANLGFKSEDFLARRTREASPNDKVVRHITKGKETGSTFGGMMKHAKEALKAKYETLTMGSKNLTSRKKALDLKSLKNKNWKKTARPTFKKDFFASNEKLSTEFLEMRRKNLNMTQAKSYADLKKSSGSTLYILKEEIEQAILLNKDIALINKSFETGFNPMAGQGLISGSRIAAMPLRQQGEMLLGQEEKLPNIMTHYSG